MTLTDWFCLAILIAGISGLALILAYIITDLIRRNIP